MISIFVCCDFCYGVCLLPKEACCTKGVELLELLAELITEIFLLQTQTMTYMLCACLCARLTAYGCSRFNMVIRAVTASKHSGNQ